MKLSYSYDFTILSTSLVNLQYSAQLVTIEQLHLFPKAGPKESMGHRNCPKAKILTNPVKVEIEKMHNMKDKTAQNIKKNAHAKKKTGFVFR